MSAINNICIFLKDHIPYNKRRYEVGSSTCAVDVRDYDGSQENEAWTEIHMSEHYTLEGSSRPMTRSMFVTLSADDRDFLIKTLTNHEEPR